MEKLYKELLEGRVNRSLQKDYRSIRSISSLKKLLKHEDAEVREITQNGIDRKFKDYVTKAYRDFYNGSDEGLFPENMEVVTRLQPLATKKSYELLPKIIEKVGRIEDAKEELSKKIKFAYGGLRTEYKQFFGDILNPVKAPHTTGKDIYFNEALALKEFGHREINETVEDGHIKKLKLEHEFSHSDQTSLGGSLSELKELEELKINNPTEWARMKQFPKEITDLTKLKELNLSQNALSKVPSDIYKLKNLEGLYLKENSFSSIPSGILRLKGLQRLILNSNNVQKIPEEISNLENLRKLCLAENKIKVIPERLTTMDNLEILELAYNEITKIPEEIEKLKSLKYLGLEGNPLEGLPKSLKKLESLEELRISNYLPKEVMEMVNLKTLIYSGNFNDGIFDIGNGNLEQLGKLWVYSSNISEIRNLTNLENLEDLTLTATSIKDLPNLSEMEKLKRVNIREAYLKSLPGNLEDYLPKTIEQLDLDSNYISEIPESILNLPNLKELSLRKNYLSKEGKAIIKQLKEKGCKINLDD